MSVQQRHDRGNWDAKVFRPDQLRSLQRGLPAYRKLTGDEEPPIHPNYWCMASLVMLHDDRNGTNARCRITAFRADTGEPFDFLCDLNLRAWKRLTPYEAWRRLVAEEPVS